MVMCTRSRETLELCDAPSSSQAQQNKVIAWHVTVKSMFTVTGDLTDH